MNKPYYTGSFAPMCEVFVEQKRAASLAYEQQAIQLRMFDNFCKNFEIKNYTITEEIVLAWCKLRPNEKEVTRHGRIGEMQRFSSFLVKQGYPSYLLPNLPQKNQHHTPYIFSQEEMRSITQRLDSLEFTNAAPIRHFVYPLLIRLLYGVVYVYPRHWHYRKKMLMLKMESCTYGMEKMIESASFLCLFRYPMPAKVTS